MAKEGDRMTDQWRDPDFQQDRKRPIPWFGYVLIGIGILLIVDELNIFYYDYYDLWDFWPVILLFLAFNRYHSNPHELFLPGLFMFLGLYFLLGNFNLLPYFIEDNFWSIVLILFGLYLIFQHRGGRVERPSGDVSDDSFIDVTNVFGSTKHIVDSKRFNGGNIFSAFGGPDIDLRGAEIEGESAEINVTILFGGAEISVPEHWNLIVKAVPIFGGTDDNRRIPQDQTAGGKSLIIRGTILFGGMDIK